MFHSEALTFYLLSYFYHYFPHTHLIVTKEITNKLNYSLPEPVLRI